MQRQIGKYRVDFAAEVGAKRVAVEVDGEEFHRNTAAEAARETAIREAGWTIVRFRGAEVWADPDACVDKLESMICGDTGGA